MLVAASLWLTMGLTMGLAGCTSDAGSDGIDPLPIGGDAGSRPDGSAECTGLDEGCLCELGRAPIDCFLDPVSVGDRVTCRAGTRYCRAGRWSACESVVDYELGGAGEALFTGPSACNPCDPRCFGHVDHPGPADLPGRSTNISYDTGRGGISLTPSTPVVPTLPDSDGDGIPDVADSCVGPGAFPSASGGCYGMTFFYHMLSYGGPTVIDPLPVQIQLRTADIYFLMDTTGSMGGELARLQTDLTTGTFLTGCGGGVVGAIRCAIPDAWFGVGYFDDFPVATYGVLGTDRVYRNVLDITSSLAATQTAISSLSIHNGYDGPESNTQALYAVASGNGFGTYLSARTGCAAGNWGYPCFRNGTIPVIIHVTDAPFHNGPSGAYTYGGVLSGTAASWSSTIAALTAREVRIITLQTCGVWYDGYCLEGESHARTLANATGSVDGTGSPYVFRGSSSGSGLSTAIVNAVVNLANYTRMNVSARPSGDTQGFTITPITAVSWGPGGNCTGISGNTFLQCTPGTPVRFNVSFRNNAVMSTTVAQVFDFFIEVVGDGTVILERIPVRIVVPPMVAAYPATGNYTRDYDSTVRCAINERPVWGTLDWTAPDLPAGTSIRFELRTSDTAAALPTATPMVTVNVPSAGTGSVNVTNALAAAGARTRLYRLRVNAVLNASPDRLRAPVLSEVRVAYTCIPDE